MRDNKYAFDRGSNASAGENNRPSFRCRHLSISQSISGMRPMAFCRYQFVFNRLFDRTTVGSGQKQPFSSADERDVRPLMVAPKTFGHVFKNTQAMMGCNGIRTAHAHAYGSRAQEPSGVVHKLEFNALNRRVDFHLQMVFGQRRY